LLGCSAEAPSQRVPLHGSVRVDGRLVTEGSLSLLPIRQHAGPAASTSISGGQYAFTAANGPNAGPHLAVVGVTAPAEPGAAADAAADVDRQAGEESMKSAPAASGQPRPTGAANPGQWELEVEVPASGDYRTDLELATGQR
jgi:hypothetical protein